MSHLVARPTYRPDETTKRSRYERTLLRYFVEQGVAMARGKDDAQFTTDVER